MTWLTHFQPDVVTSVRVVWALAHFLWQGVLIGAIVWMLDPWLNRCKAGTRYNVFSVALLVLAACPVANFLFLSRSSASARESSGVVVDALERSQDSRSTLPRAVADAAPLEPVSRTVAATGKTAKLTGSTDRIAVAAPWAVMGYVAGVLFMLARLGVAVIAGRSLCRSIVQPLEGTVEVFNRLAAQMRMKVVPALGYCAHVATPSVVGIVRPIVLLPVSAVSELSASQLEAILAHELAHVRRLDVVANMLQRLIESFLFFHPAVWFISNRIRVERENCCDDLVLSLGADPGDYARALVQIAQSKIPLPAPLAMAATGAGSRLRKRILRIMGSDSRDAAILPRSGVAFVTVLAVLAMVVIRLHASVLANQTTSDSGSMVRPTPSAIQLHKRPPGKPLQVARGELMDADADSPDAVSRGLQWLAGRVGADGSIQSKHDESLDIALSSFAGLTFLASGSTTENGPYARQLKAIAGHILSNQQPSGLIAPKAVQGPMYSHGYAMLFLAESYMKHPDDQVKAALVKAIALTEKNANSEGGWRYQAQPLDADISVTACQLNALLACKACGIPVNEKVLDNAIQYVRKCQNPDGGFSYMVGQGGFGGSGWPRSAAAVSVLIHGGTKLVDDTLVRAMRYASDTTLKAKPGAHYFYGMYYTSQWITAAARDEKTAEAMRTTLLGAQREDGSWNGEISPEYATANALLVLQARDARLWMFK